MKVIFPLLYSGLRHSFTVMPVRQSLYFCQSISLSHWGRNFHSLAKTLRKKLPINLHVMQLCTPEL